MITDEQLRTKFSEINYYTKNEDFTHDETHRIDLCLVTINKLLSLGEKRRSTLPISFEKFGVDLERYVTSKEYIDDDISYLICASFLKEYYLYKKYIDKDGFEQDDVYGVWRDFEDLSIPISNTNEVFNLNFYKGLKSKDSYLNNFYIFLSIQNESNKFFIKSIDDKKNESISALELKNTELNSGLKHFSEMIDDLRKETNELAFTLKEQKTAFNFVGLSQGFESLLKAKKNSQTIVLSLLFFIGIFLFIPLFTYIELNQVKDLSGDFLNWKMFLPFVSIELISLYLFRVILTHYNSIKTQIMQLELRQTLCQFIQSYVEYAKEIKEKDSASLEKFENLIFSSILSTPDKVPSTFDGIEQLSNLIKNIKSGN
ncbi:MAG: hypothetical protein UE367_05685 [Haemophilus parainfluenzae]|jgi:hypothetical protein|nr:hypothetical protein [Haemophilus parainfluenzae]